uniref:Putative serine/threonine-protein kinase n=1 Tax=Aedes albopictus TaxID=7160 RepID=A0A023EQY6_AEDAL
MGNTSSNNSRRATINHPETRNSSAKSSLSPLPPSSSLSVLAASPLLEVGEGATGHSSHRSQALKRAVSLDGFSSRLNDSFRRFYRSLSCTSLSGSGPQKRQSSNQSSRRPWSRVSRRRWNEAALADDRLRTRTCWPVTHAESLFLPQFPVDSHAERRYVVVEYIANGAFGKVHRVRKANGDAGQDFALKVLSKSEIINGNAIRQLKDEVDIQTICGHHPFLAKCVDYWQSKKKVFLLSNYYPNGELFQKFKSFPFELVRLYIAEIALALDFLHQAGVIYRDLKPENVLLDQDYHVRLIDFGLSKWLSIGSRTRTLCGTLQYMGKTSF